MLAENAEDIARLRQQEEQEEKDAGRKRKRKGPQGSRTDASEGAAAEGEGGEMGAVDAGLETSDTAQRAVLAGEGVCVLKLHHHQRSYCCCPEEPRTASTTVESGRVYAGTHDLITLLQHTQVLYSTS